MVGGEGTLWALDAYFCTCCRVCTPVLVWLPACNVAMMALFWMIDVLEETARSPGWARASV
ncbi:hypothetical protein CRENBAI_010239 [Crenichthys baileyi]|uniref:Uncharacterized protein n=1 Tax=Crenichthys baileyi TaxID=28760 RepID=A0AAV9RKA3_9TELE